MMKSIIASIATMAFVAASDPFVPTNQCVAAGATCPDFGGSFWECCTHACDPDNKVCKECSLANETCKSDDDCCYGFCEVEKGTCAACLPAGKACGMYQYAEDGCCYQRPDDPINPLPQLKCSEERHVCFECLQEGGECESDDDCCYKCCDKKLFHKKGKCAEPEREICHWLHEYLNVN